MSRPASKDRGERGMTLVELLVAMTLLALISVALFGGLRFGTRAWEVGAQRSEIFAQVESAQSLLRRQLSRAVALPIPGPKKKWTFEGTEERLDFTAPAPSQFGVGGIYRFELFAEPGPEGEHQQVILRWKIYRSEQTGPLDGEDSETRALLEGIEDLRFSYFGLLERQEEAEWNDHWTETDGLPELILVDVIFPRDDDRRWPELLIAPRAALGAIAP